MAAYIGLLPPVSRCHHVHFSRSGCQALACLLSPVLSAPSTARSLQAQGPLCGVRMSAHGPVRSEGDVQRWPLPGPLVWQLVCLALLAMVLSGVVSAWLLVRSAGQQALEQLQSQQTDEVEMVARLLASKIEQSQKVLRTLAAGITPAMLDSPALLQGLLQQGLPAVPFFDAVQVARQDGQLRVNLRNGRFESLAGVEPVERDALRRTLVSGKPMVSELVAARASEARVLFTMPLLRSDGAVLGVVAGALRLQSQGLLPASMAPPQRGHSRLVVFTRDGTILLHSDPARTQTLVRDEPGLAQAHARWLAEAQPITGAGSTQRLPGYIVSMAGIPLPQWMVARVTDSGAVLAPLQEAQRQAWWLATASMALLGALVVLTMLWLAQPLARLCERAQALWPPAPGPAPDWPRAGGEVGALVQVFQYLEQQRAHHQQQHQALAGRFQAILEHASVGIVITRGGRLKVLGRQACQMLGYTAQELQGQPARILYPSEADYAELGARVQAGFAAHGAFEGEVCFRRKDASPVWARVQGRAVQAHSMRGGTVWILEDITALRAARQHGAWAATHDSLTQLPNRQGLEQRLHLLLAERAQRLSVAPPVPSPEPAPAGQGCDGVVLFLDLDHFSVVNDVAGHGAGDDVLRRVAGLVQAQVRQIGWAARLGGDQFVVVLPGCTLAHAQVVAEQLRATVQAWAPAYQGRSFALGVSIGLVVLDTARDQVRSVLHAADMACYQAKRAGRNRVVVGDRHSPHGPDTP